MLRIPPNFHRVKSRQGWHKTAGGDRIELERQALALHRDIPEPAQVFCGLIEDDQGHAIYLIESCTPIEIAREFGTGSHNTGPGGETEQVCEELEHVFRIAPFRPYFADAAGYKARFHTQITQEQAEAIEEILTVGLEGYVFGVVRRWSFDDRCTGSGKRHQALVGLIAGNIKEDGIFDIASP